MSRIYKYRIAGSILLMLISGIGVVASLFSSWPLLGAVNGFVFGFWAVQLTFAIKGVRRGHRAAAGDRDNSYPSPEYRAELEAKLAHLSARRAALEATLTAPGLKESEAEIPILAYKVAGLAWWPNLGPRFRPLNQQNFYEADEDAVCNRPREDFARYSMHLGISPNAYRSFPRVGAHAAPSVECSCGFYGCTEQSMLEGGVAILEVEFTGRVVVCERGYRAGHQRVIRCHLRGCHYCGDAPTTVSFEAKHQLCLRCDEHATTEPSISIAKLGSLLGVPVDVDKSVKKVSA